MYVWRIFLSEYCLKFEGYYLRKMIFVPFYVSAFSSHTSGKIVFSLVWRETYLGFCIETRPTYALISSSSAEMRVSRLKSNVRIRIEPIFSSTKAVRVGCSISDMVISVGNGIVEVSSSFRLVCFVYFFPLMFLDQSFLPSCF